MDKKTNDIIEKFIAGNILTEDESIRLDKRLNDSHYREELADFLENKWDSSESEDVQLQFEQIRKQIRGSSSYRKTRRLFIVLSKAAALLIVPILAAALYFYFTQPVSDEMLTLSTQKGELTNVILPDGSKVWLNVDSKLSYPLNYGTKSRSLELKGEAYFEVEKNEKLPFEVTAGNVTTKALGTRFVISAYPESSEVKSSLVEGAVEVSCGPSLKVLHPGQQFVLYKNRKEYTVKSFNKEYELGWKDKQLAFYLASFDDVIEQLEKWYNINIEYDSDSFKSETLTVRFEKNETLEQVLKVFSKANGFQYSVEGGRVIIKK
ncbi:FecR family protein [Mariniphaga anaerophila]|uniref:FecR family protein n=1 Tax=Mariniphaga anaerophila TaxID=1484053 RepID=A0A1M5F9Y7_9BACT|nr:FecR family protein [Mariniphaga anaerophila]SHF88289.1 FecR family protein [Mariniphaga anaerophila]